MEQQTSKTRRLALDGWQLTTGALMFMMALLADTAAFAQAADFGEGICAAVDIMTGPAGKAVATAGIIVIAVGALLGRVSWGMAVMIAAGIAGIFGAPIIAQTIADASGGAGSGGDFCAV